MHMRTTLRAARQRSISLHVKISPGERAVSMRGACRILSHLRGPCRIRSCLRASQAQSAHKQLFMELAECKTRSTSLATKRNGGATLAQPSREPP